MKKSRRTYNGVHLNKKSNTQDVVEQSLTKLLNGRNLIRQKIRLLTAIFSLHSESLQFDCHKQQYFSMGT